MYKTRINKRLITKEQLQSVALAVLPELTRNNDVKDSIELSFTIAQEFYNTFEERYEKKRSVK
jgi:hypothetical protein